MNDTGVESELAEDYVAEELLRDIRELWKDPQLRAEGGRQTRRYAIPHCSPDVYPKLVLHFFGGLVFYESALKERRAFMRTPGMAIVDSAAREIALFGDDHSPLLREP